MLFTMPELRSLSLTKFYLELFSIIPNIYNLVFSFDIHPTAGEGEICDEYSIVDRTGQNHFRTCL